MEGEEREQEDIPLVPTPRFLRHAAKRLSYRVVKHEITLPTRNKLGTFFGVFVPTLLGTLGGVILLRLSWIVGQAGY